MEGWREGGREERREGGLGFMGEGLHGGSYSRRNAGAACAEASVGFLLVLFRFWNPTNSLFQFLQAVSSCLPETL